MFLFMDKEAWRQYMDELGIRKTIDYLIAKNLPAEWPTMVLDPSGEYVQYLPGGKPWYKSNCPFTDALSFSESRSLLHLLA